MTANQATINSMITGQIFTNHVHDVSVINALKQIPREQFVPESLKGSAYADEAVLLRGETQRYVPQPLVFARMLQLAKIESSHRILDVASASGYTSAVISCLAKDVIALESESEFTAKAKTNFNVLGIRNIKLVTGDLILGATDYKPFDIIFIEGMVDFVPDSILKQLKVGGRLVALLANSANSNIGDIVVMEKGEKSVAITKHFQAIANKLEEFTKEVGFRF